MTVERLTDYADLGDAQILETWALDMLNDAFISDELPAPVGPEQSYEVAGIAHEMMHLTGA